MQVAPESAPLLLPGRDQSLPGLLQLTVGGDRLDERTDLGAHVLQESSVPRPERVVTDVDLDPQPTQRRPSDGQVDGRRSAVRRSDGGGDRLRGRRREHVDGGEGEVEAPGQQLEDLAQGILRRRDRVQPTQVGHDPVRELPVAVDHSAHGPLHSHRDGQQQEGEQATGEHRADGDVGRDVHRLHQAGERCSDHHEHQCLDQSAPDPRLELGQPVAGGRRAEASHRDAGRQADEEVSPARVGFR